MVNFEWSPDDYELTFGGDHLAHTSHFLGSKMRVYQPKQSKYSGPRLETVNRLLSENPTPDDLKRILSYHSNNPDRDLGSVCNHENIVTIASIVLDPRNGLLYLAEGNPCKNEYREIRLHN